MEKIAKHPKDIRLEGIVEDDGVGFIPVKIVGPASVCFTGCLATTEKESNEIKRKPVNTTLRSKNTEDCYKRKMDEKIKKRGITVILFSALGIIASLIMMCVCVKLPNQEILINLFATIVYFMMIVLILHKAFAIWLGKIFRNKEYMNFSKFLGAKNAAENAFYDLGRVPTMEEIKEYSLYSAEDKYTKNSYIATLWLVLSCVRFLDGWAFWVVTICTILLLCWLEAKEKLAFIQALVVSKPEEKHYEVAIAALEEAADILEHVEVRFQEVEIELDPENFNEETCKECPAYDYCKEECQKMAEEKNDEDSSD